MSVKYYILGLLALLSLHSYAQKKAIMTTRWTEAAMKASMPFPDYPRPQLQRSDWLNLNGRWDYTGGKNAVDVSTAIQAPSFSHTTEKIIVPYPPESYLSGIERKQEINMWYRRSFTIPSSWKGRHVLLNFGAVDFKSLVFINGKKAGAHDGGYDAFSFDITSLLQPGDNIIVVGAQDKNDGHSPSGKNEAGPYGDYIFTSGIWQTVWLEPVAENYISGIKLTPNITNNKLHVQVASNTGRMSISAVASGKNVSAVNASGTTNQSFDINIDNPVLWSPGNPFLYDLKLQLKDKNGNVTDEITSYFGMRSVALGEVAGVKRALLNGQFLLQLGLLDQGYWPEGAYTAPNDDALKSDIEVAKKAGFNLIRKHMKTEPQRWYYWCDKMGMMVWQDMPCVWYPNGNDSALVRSRYRTEWKEIIDEHYNAPSIVAWVPFNENWGAFDIQNIINWTKQYDSSRLVNGNTGFNNLPPGQRNFGDPGNGDFVDVHVYVGPYGASVPDGKRAASLGEFGGVGLFVRNHLYPVANNAYAMEPTSEDLTNRYVLLLNEVEQLVKYKGLSIAIYTQTTDVEHEINGLLTYDREVEKMDLKKVADINTAVINSSKELNEKE